MARYVIEVNTARAGAEPIWRDLVDDNNATCWWDFERDARQALADEGRGANARIMQFINGIGKPLPDRTT